MHSCSSLADSLTRLGFFVCGAWDDDIFGVAHF